MKARTDWWIRGFAVFGSLMVGAVSATGQEMMRYGVKSVVGVNESHARIVPAAAEDGSCKQAFRLTETEGEGEHVVYGAVRLSADVRFKFRARANNRYVIQLGFAGPGWTSYAIGTVNLISGAHTAIEGGQLQVKEVVVKDTAAKWKEIELRAIAKAAPAESGKAAPSESSKAAPSEQGGYLGYALIKLVANNDTKSYRGAAGYGVEICDDRP